jgi:ATP-dependent exoDNAse (exonuclease V) alpha subunit
MKYAVPDFAEIKTIMRQKDAGRSTDKEERKKESELHLQAVTALENGLVKDALDTFKKLDCVEIQKDINSAAEAASDAYFEFRKSSDETQVIVTAANHADVNRINEKIREELGINGTGQVIKTAEGLREFAEGDRIIFRKNRPKKGESEQLTNGDLGTIVGMRMGENGPILSVLRDIDKKAGKGPIDVDTSEYKDLRHGYAMTVHASQGVTVERAVGVANANSALANQNIMYVQSSRHKLDYHLVGYAETDPDKVNERLEKMGNPDPESPDFEKLKDEAERAEIEALIYKQYSRSAEKETTLDFLFNADAAADQQQQAKEQAQADAQAEAEAEDEAEL